MDEIEKLDGKTLAEYQQLISTVQAKQGTIRRNKMEMELHRWRISQLYLQGTPIAEIARELEISPGVVRSDIGVVRQRWIEAGAASFQEIKSKQLARIDNLERTYWEAYEDSFDDDIVSTQYLRRDQDNQGGELASDRAAVTKRKGKGDMAALQGVQWCIQERSKLLGLYSAVKFEAEIRAQYTAVNDVYLDAVMDAVAMVYGEEEESAQIAAPDENVVDGEIMDEEE